MNVYDEAGDPREILANPLSPEFFEPRKVKGSCVLVALNHLLGVVLLRNLR